MTCWMQLFVLVVKLLVSFYKDENIVTFLFIHTIQLIFTASKTTPFFFENIILLLFCLLFLSFFHCHGTSNVSVRGSD